MLKRFKDLEGNKECSLYNLINFNPVIFNEEFLRNIKIYGDISQTAVQGLINGSKKFRKLFDSQKLTPNKDYSLVNYSGEPFHIHNYTGKCPTNVFEVTPSIGSCSTSCLYCLVSSGHSSW